MDVFTDIDIFRDLQEISRKQGVAVYILLDQALLSQFLDMCMDLKVHPEKEKVCGNVFPVSPRSAVRLGVRDLHDLYGGVWGGNPHYTRGHGGREQSHLPEISQKRNRRARFQTSASPHVMLPPSQELGCWPRKAALQVLL